MSLIDVTYLRTLISFATNVDDSDIENRIREAEEFDIETQLGKELLADLITNPGSGDNPGLIDLIKPAEAYYAYARYLDFSNVQPTAFKLVIKETPNSSTAPRGESKNTASTYRNMAYSFFVKSIDYINENRASFPLFEGAGRPVYGVRIMGISNTNCD